MIHQGGLSNNAPSCSFNRNPSTLATPPHSAIELPMRHCLQRVSLKWTREEQHVLEVLLHRHAKEPVLTRYALIAMQLENKSIRDVALRVRWMSKKENGNFGKRRKDDVKLARESKDKKEATSSLFAAQPSIAVSSHFAAQPPSAVPSHFAAPPPAARPSLFAARPHVAVPSHFAAQPPAARPSLFGARPATAVPSHIVARPPATMPSHFAARPNAYHLVPGMATMNIDDGISYGATEGVINEKLEQNDQALRQISRNLASFQVQGCIKLFCQTRQNLINIMNELKGMDLMMQMPPLPLKLDEIPILPETESAPLGCGTQLTT